jgi:predicted metalloprotease with PDZ domain
MANFSALFSFRNVLSGLCGVMCCFVQAQALQYRIAPVLDQPNPYLNVSVRYQPPVGDTETSFSYPNAHWGEQDLWNCLQALQANGQLFMERDSGRFTIKHPPGAAVEVTYRIQPDQFSPLVWERSFRPIVESGSFHVFGFALFAVPDKYWGNNASGAPVSFAWAGPANTPLASSLYAGFFGTKTIEVTRLMLDESVFVGGDIRVRALPINQDTVYLAYKPFEHLNMDTVANTLQKAVSSQRAFWHETQPYYLVTLFPTYDVWNDTSKHLSVGGSGLHQSFACMVSDNRSPLKEKRVAYLFFHEMMHHWIGNTIRTADEEKQYWFSEGFTDYYQSKLRLRSGVLSTKQFIDEINNDLLKPYYESPVRNAPNDSMTYANFWNDRFYEKLPYQRGFLFAFLLDNQIKHKGDKSLDDGMFRLLEVSRRRPDLRMNNERLVEHLTEATDLNIQPLFDQYIQQGQTIECNSSQLPPGLKTHIEPNGACYFALDADKLAELGVFLKK